MRVGACVYVNVSMRECVVILRLSYFFCFSFVFNYYLQRTIKFNLIFKRYTRSMYSGTVSLEYHADVTIPFFYIPILPLLVIFFVPIADNNGIIPFNIPLSQSGVSLFSAHFLALRTVPLGFKKKSVLPLFVFPREFFRMFLYIIIIYSNVKNHGPLNRT